MPPDYDPALAGDDLMRSIEINRGDRGASDCRQTNNEQSIFTPAEMVAPALGTGIL
jgi:hypothetical protein